MLDRGQVDRAGRDRAVVDSQVANLGIVGDAGVEVAIARFERGSEVGWQAPGFDGIVDRLHCRDDQTRATGADVTLDQLRPCNGISFKMFCNAVRQTS